MDSRTTRSGRIISLSKKTAPKDDSEEAETLQIISTQLSTMPTLHEASASNAREEEKMEDEEEEEEELIENTSSDSDYEPNDDLLIHSTAKKKKPNEKLKRLKNVLAKEARKATESHENSNKSYQEKFLNKFKESTLEKKAEDEDPEKIDDALKLHIVKLQANWDSEKEKSKKYLEEIKSLKTDLKEMTEELEDAETTIGRLEAKITMMEASKNLQTKLDDVENITFSLPKGRIGEVTKVFLRMPELVNRIEEVLQNPSALRQPAFSQESSFLENINHETPQPDQIQSNPQLELSVIIPKEPEAKWTFFREKVACYTEKQKTEYSYSLLHTEQNPELYDIAKCDPKIHAQGKFFIHRGAIERARISSTSFTGYATALFPDYFKLPVALFCTCDGSTRGRAADGNPRAGLPKPALNVFLDHCIYVGKRANFPEANDQKIKKKLKSAINTYLQTLRINYSFTPTKEQLDAYNAKFKRGEKKSTPADQVQDSE